MACANNTLSDAQKAILKKITDMGRASGMSDREIELAVQTAFQESSLGSNMGSPPGSTAVGLFQYNVGTWGDRHSDLDRSNMDHQIIAIFRDMIDLQGRYNNGVQSGDIPNGMTFDEYFYIRHHDGHYYQDLANAPGGNLWEAFPDFCLPPAPPPAPNSPGGGGGYDPTYFDGGDRGEDYSWIYDYMNSGRKPIIEFSELEVVEGVG